MKAEVSLMRNGNATDFINLLIFGKENFTLNCSNYTISIDTENFKKRFVTMMQSPRTFGAFSKLKKDLKTQAVPVIDKSKLRYYVHDFKRPAYYETVFNIDLKSAYATILINDGFITKDTFDYLRKLNKQQRLASVGMLASHKDIFNFKKGEIESTDEYNSEFSSFFFYLVKRTDEIMMELKTLCGRKHLFTWVDGIYFMPDEDVMSECMIYLDSIKFPYSVEVLTEFKVDILATNTRVTLKKDGKIKPFSLPHTDNGFKKVLKDFLLTQNKNNEQKAGNEKVFKKGR